MPDFRSDFFGTFTVSRKEYSDVVAIKRECIKLTSKAMVRNRQQYLLLNGV